MYVHVHKYIVLAAVHVKTGQPRAHVSHEYLHSLFRSAKKIFAPIMFFLSKRERRRIYILHIRGPEYQMT